MKDAFPKWFHLLVAAAVGAMLMSLGPQVIDAMSAPDAPLLWWLARSLGLLAWLALFFSMLFGVFVSSRGAGGLLHAASLVDLHNRWALVALLATGLHVLALVADANAGIGAVGALVPFASPRLRGPVALGTIAAWGLGLVALSTALSRHIPRLAWRAVHALAFGTFLLSLVHAITAGSDSGSPAVAVGYAAMAAVLIGAIVQRVLLARFAPER